MIYTENKRLKALEHQTNVRIKREQGQSEWRPETSHEQSLVDWLFRTRLDLRFR